MTQKRMFIVVFVGLAWSLLLGSRPSDGNEVAANPENAGEIRGTVL